MFKAYYLPSTVHILMVFYQNVLFFLTWQWLGCIVRTQGYKENNYLQAPLWLGVGVSAALETIVDKYRYEYISA